jgi:hypothetical protein
MADAGDPEHEVRSLAAMSSARPRRAAGSVTLDAVTDNSQNRRSALRTARLTCTPNLKMCRHARVNSRRCESG